MYFQSDALCEHVFVFLFEPGDHLAPKSTHTPPDLILKAQLPKTATGANGLFLRPGDLTVEAVITPDGQRQVESPFAYEFQFFSEEQRQAREASHEVLQGILDDLTGAADPVASDLVPFVILRMGAGEASLHHFTDFGLQGALFLRYETLALEEAAGFGALDALLARGYPRLRRIHELLNHDCTFSRWQSEYELERKFTFDGLPDTWMLTQEFYRRIRAGEIPGFVPELGLEFQVYDYESHVFEVSAPPSEAGYISFIPQSDGKMTVKRKWFQKNAELRKETIFGHQDIDFRDIEAHLRTMTSGMYRKLSAFRRKRFDAHLESLTTGHIFGVYFDICRIVGDNDTLMSQCEVEYCRSRTLVDLGDVYSEFEFLANYVEEFLAEYRVTYEHNLYSKLDFVRDHVESLSESVEG